MASFDERSVIEFLRRSYIAVDGLWFVKVEDRHSFDEAMLLDEEVWRVLPKIQARKAMRLLGRRGGSLSDLAECLELKLTAEGHNFSIDQDGGSLRVEIRACPWLELLKKSDKLDRAETICNHICALDLGIWASECAGGALFSLRKKLSAGDPSCEIVYSKTETSE